MLLITQLKLLLFLSSFIITFCIIRLLPFELSSVQEGGNLAEISVLCTYVGYSLTHNKAPGTPLK